MSELDLLLYLKEMHEVTGGDDIKKQIDELTAYINGCIKAVKELKGLVS